MHLREQLELKGGRTNGCNTNSTIFCSTTRRDNFLQSEYESRSYLNALTYLHSAHTFDTILPQVAADRNWGILYSNLRMGENVNTVTNTQLDWPIHRVLTTGFSTSATMYDIAKYYVSPTSTEFTPHDMTVTTLLYNQNRPVADSNDNKFANDIHVNIDADNGIQEFTVGFRGVVSADNLDSYIESLSAAPNYRQLFAIDIKGGELDFSNVAQCTELKYYTSLTNHHREKLYSFNQNIASLAIKKKRIKSNTWYIEDETFTKFQLDNNNVACCYISTANPNDKTSQHNYFTGEDFSTNFNNAKIYQTDTDASADLATARSIAGTDCSIFSFKCVTISQPTIEYNSPATNFVVSNLTYNTTCRFLSCKRGNDTLYYVGDPENYIPGDMSQWVDAPSATTTQFALINDSSSENYKYIQYYCGPSNMPYHNAISHSDNWALSITAATNVRAIDYRTIHDLIAADPTLSLLAVEQKIQDWMNYTAFRNETRSLELWQTASADLPGYTFESQNISAALTNAQLNSIFDRTLSASTVATDNDKSFFSIPQMDFIALEYIIKPVSGNS